MESLRIGIAGFGVVGKRRKLCVDAHKNAEVIAVCDKNIFEPYVENGIHYCSSYHHLLEKNLDALIVCMTNDVAAEVTIAGLKKGLHVLCEKPPGKDMADITKVMETKGKYPELELMYGFNHRYHDSVIEAKKMIDMGELGKIINLRGVYGKSKLITFNQPDWRTKREIAGGGVLLDQGIHMVDLMRLFAGDFTTIHSFVSNKYWKYDVEDNAYAIMMTDSGVVGMLNSSATQWRHQFQLDINLEKGSLILSGILSGSKSYGAETLKIVYSDPDNDMGDPKEHIIHYNKDPSWDREIECFCDAILNNKTIGKSTCQDAFQAMKLVYQIYFSDPVWRNRFNIQNPEGYDL